MGTLPRFKGYLPEKKPKETPDEWQLKKYSFIVNDKSDTLNENRLKQFLNNETEYELKVSLSSKNDPLLLEYAATEDHLFTLEKGFVNKGEWKKSKKGKAVSFSCMGSSCYMSKRLLLMQLRLWKYTCTCSKSHKWVPVLRREKHRFICQPKGAED